jgi:hypothetical protein
MNNNDNVNSSDVKNKLTLELYGEGRAYVEILQAEGKIIDKEFKILMESFSRLADYSQLLTGRVPLSKEDEQLNYHEQAIKKISQSLHYFDKVSHVLFSRRIITSSKSGAELAEDTRKGIISFYEESEEDLKQAFALIGEIYSSYHASNGKDIFNMDALPKGIKKQVTQLLLKRGLIRKD